MRPFRENLGLKLLAFVLACCLWVYVTQHEDLVNVPQMVRLDVRGVPDNEVAAPAVSQVPVVVSGPKLYASRVTGDTIAAYVDVKGRAPGLYKLDVHADLPQNIRGLVTVSPSSTRADVRVDAKETRSVKVSAEWQGALPPGADYGPSTIEPSSVQVTGAAGAVDDVERAVVKIPSGDPTVNDEFYPVAVNKRDRVVPDVNVIPTHVRVQATLMRTQGTRQVFVSPVTVGQPAAGYSVAGLATEPQSVVLLGPARLVQKVDSVATKAVDVRGRSADVVQVIAIRTPSGMTASPSKVRVRVRLTKSSH